MESDRLLELLPDGLDGVECGHRVLVDHRDLTAPDLRKARLVQRHQVHAVEKHRARNAAGRMDQPHQRERRQGLATPRFAHQPHPLAGRHLERDPANRSDQAPAGGEGNGQILDIEGGCGPAWRVVCRAMGF